MSEHAFNSSDPGQQLAAADPAADTPGSSRPDVAPVAPGLAPAAVQATGGAVLPDLTLLDLEDLLRLDPTDESGPLGRALGTAPLAATLDNAGLPADLTSLDLEQLLELQLGGAKLPTLLEIAGLPAPPRGDEAPPAEDDHVPGEAAQSFVSEHEASAPESPPSVTGALVQAGAAPDVTAPPADPLAADEIEHKEAGLDLADPFDVGGDLPGHAAVAGFGDAPGPAGGNGTAADGMASGDAGWHAGAPAQGQGQANSGTPAAVAQQGQGLNAGGGTAAVGNSGGSTGASSSSDHSGRGELAVAVAAIDFARGGEPPIAVTPAGSAAGGGHAQASNAAASAVGHAHVPAATPPSHYAATFVAESDSGANTEHPAQAGHAGGPVETPLPALDMPKVDVAPVEPKGPPPAEVGNQPAAVSGLHGGGDDIVGTPGDDTLMGGGGNDTIDGLAGGDAIDGNAGNDRLIGGDNEDLLNGRGGDDTLMGGDGADTLIGGGGDDLLDGGAGADVLSGGGGADTLVWDAGDSLIDGGGNTDTLRIVGGDVDITNLTGTITGIDQIDLAFDAHRNQLTVSYQDVLDMTDGADTLTVFGNVGDVVHAGTGWTDQGTTGGFDVYTQGNGGNTATLVVETGVMVLV